MGRTPKLQQGQSKKTKKTENNLSNPPSQRFKPNLKSEQKEDKRRENLVRTEGGQPLYDPL